MRTGTVASISGRLFPRRIGSVEWSGGNLRVTLCPASKQIVLRQGEKEISFPAHKWVEIEELAAKLVLPKGQPG